MKNNATNRRGTNAGRDTLRSSSHSIITTSEFLIGSQCLAAVKRILCAILFCGGARNRIMENKWIDQRVQWFKVTNKCERHGQTKEEMESSLWDLLFLLPRLYIGETGENLWLKDWLDTSGWQGKELLEKKTASQEVK